jgi:hypothetical protein
MSGKHSTEQEKIEWLIDNEELWFADYEYHKDILEVKMAKEMRNAGLYQKRTQIHSIKVLPILAKAKKKLDRMCSD